MGVQTMYWTFDPLESRNAHLNLNVLGAAVESYVPHFYGETAVAATDTVIGTDRFVVKWDLSVERTIRSATSLTPAEAPSVGLDTMELPSPGSTDTILIGAPADIQSLKATNAETAKRWRQLTRHAFTRYLDAGYAVSEFRVESEGRGGWYVLTNK
jgi:predicted GNAT superfamily acetyltransferase